MKNPVRLLLADDHAIVIAGLSALLGLEPGFEVTATAEDGEEAVRKYDEHRPDVALLDLRMPGMGGIEAARRILSRHPGARILIISTFESEEDIHRALVAGVGGYLLKGSKRPELVAAIRAVFEGKRWLSAPVARLAAERAKQPDLTARQVEVLDLVSKGLSTKEMAEKLHVSVKTVEVHRVNIKEKLNTPTAPDLIRYAVRWVETQSSK